MLHIELIRHVNVAGKAALYGKSDVQPQLAKNELLMTALLNQLASTEKKTATALCHQHYDLVISSPLQRCALIAKQFADKTQTNIIINTGFQEMNFGVYDGVPFDELSFDHISPNEKAASPSTEGQCKSESKAQTEIKSKPLQWTELEAFFKSPASVQLPEAESLADFHQRVISAWLIMVAEQLAVQQEQTQHQEQSQNTDKVQSKPANEKEPRRIVVFAHGGVIRMILAHILELNWQQASWYQNLHIDYGSATHITIRLNTDTAFSLENTSKILASDYFVQVNTIAMPLLPQ